MMRIKLDAAVLNELCLEIGRNASFTTYNPSEFRDDSFKAVIVVLVNGVAVEFWANVPTKGSTNYSPAQDAAYQNEMR